MKKVEPREVNLRYQSKRPVGANMPYQKTNSSTGRLVHRSFNEGGKTHGFLDSCIARMLKKFSVPFAVLIVWEISLLVNQSGWTSLILVPVGALVGCCLIEIDWLFPNKNLKKILPLLLLPLTFFILTSTPGLFGKALIIFLNLRLLLDKDQPSPDNRPIS
ncbi:MAG: hypothetical protein ABH867_01510 [Patescibacteria group bacterium]|nr:hypothetical protein [Patescibacteria group bacterium]